MPVVTAVALNAPSLSATIGEAVGAVARQHVVAIAGDTVPTFIERAAALFVRHEAPVVAKLGSKGAGQLSPRHFGIWLKGLTKGDVEAILAGKATGAEVVIAGFCQEHERLLGSKYATSDEDFAAAMQVVNGARQNAKGTSQSPKLWVEHWVKHYLAEEKARGRAPALKHLADRVRTQANTLGRPGEAVPAANTGARGPAPNFRPADTLQPEGGWTPHVPAIDVRALAEKAQAELDAETAAEAAPAAPEGKAA